MRSLSRRAARSISGGGMRRRIQARALRLELRSGSVAIGEAPRAKSRHALLTGAAGITLVLIAAITASSYLQGGGRLTIAVGRADSRVSVGDEFHFIVPIRAKGTVRLRSATVNSEVGGATVTTRLVRLRSGAVPGTHGGTLGPNYQVVALKGQRVSDDDGDGRFALDVSVVAERPGVHPLSPVRLTYESGQFRQRTSTMESPGCVDVRVEIDGSPSGCP